MADKNQLTVAELLARNKKARGEKDGKDEKRSRRHRRSLEEGGISVAELTGNLKKVKAAPVEAKHTSVSIDEDAPVIRAPKPEEKADSASAKKPAAKPAEKAAEKAAEKPVAKPADKPAQPAAAKAAEKPAAKAAQPAAKDAAKKNQPSADDTAVIQRVDKKKADEAKAAAARPAAGKAATGKATADKPAAEKPPADKAAAEKPAAEKERAEKGTKATGAAAAGAGAAAAGGATAAAVPASKKAGVAKNAEETGNLPKVEDDEDWVEEEHEKLNPVSILLMIVAGILLAIVIFKGFEILWDSFPRLVVAVLAVCVTAIMVGVTHALRTARDGFSMFLAGFTGLILTFGPLLLVML
mgnify:CR=1 FL=1